MHIAWSRINQETLTAKPLPFFKQRLKQVCRELEERFGLTPVPNERQSSIRFAPTRAEQEQARRLSVDVHVVRESVANCYKRSDCGRSFRDALSREGLFLARGDRRDFIVVDGAGGIHALGKRILGVPAAEIRHRLADLCPDQLPTLEQTREFIAAIKPVALDNKFSLEQTPKFIAATKSLALDRKFNDDCGHTKDVPTAASEHKRTRHGVAERKVRAEGRDQSRDKIPLVPVRVNSADPLDPPPVDPLSPTRSAESEPSTIDQFRNQTHDPAVAEAKNHEPLPVTTGQPEQTSRMASRDKTDRKPAIEALSLPKQPPSAHKTPGRAARVRGQFRAVVKQLTAKVHALRLRPRKRRREEIGGAFRKAGFGILRSIARIPPLHFLDPTWEAFTWLHLWEYNSRSSTDFHQSHSSSPPQNQSMRL